MNLGGDYRYGGEEALAPYRSLAQRWLECCTSCVDCLLSPSHLLTEEGAEPFVQIGDNACQVNRGQLQ